MSDIVENEELDRDTVGQEELERLFNKQYNLVTETAISLNKSYINKLSVSKSLNVAVSLVDNSIEVYRLNNVSLSRVCRLSGHKKGLTEVVFCPKNDNLLYTSSQDGLLKLWDTRASGTCAQEFKDDAEIPKSYECMDVSQNGRVLCAGTQLVEDDAYLVFWDQRNPTPLGGYWNCHTDDITQVKFHKQKTEILATGSLDGLLNVFNVLEQTEDDALTYSLNVENSVEKLTWLDEKQVSCITQSNDLQLWDTDNGDLLKSYPRDKIARSIKDVVSIYHPVEDSFAMSNYILICYGYSRYAGLNFRSREDDCYVVDAFMADESTVVLAGSHAGDGDILRSVTITEKKLQPTTIFKKNKQIVRCCSYDKDRNILVTTGESGLISVWTEGASDATPQKLARSMNKLHVNRHKPY